MVRLKTAEVFLVRVVSIDWRATENVVQHEQLTFSLKKKIEEKHDS